MRDMKSRRRTTLLNGLSVPAQSWSAQPFVHIKVWEGVLTTGKESVQLHEELDVDVFGHRSPTVGASYMVSVETVEWLAFLVIQVKYKISSYTNIVDLFQRCGGSVNFEKGSPSMRVAQVDRPA